MKITGSEAIPFPVETVWDALLDPAVLVGTIPGCERLVAVESTTDEHTYDMTVTAGVASIRGSYDGTCRLTDLVPHESLVMHLRGAGAPGTIDATVRVSFRDRNPTVVEYVADATVGGMVGGVGQRMLASVAKRMAKEFFGNVADAIASTGVRAGDGGPPDWTVSSPTAASPSAATPGQVFTPSARSADAQQEFRKGIVVGAGLVLLGVVAGRLLGRRG